MIFRLAAVVIDGGLTLQWVLRAIWRGLPGDLLGLLVLRGTGIPGPTRAASDGHVEVFVVEDRRAGRYLDAMPIRPHAQTLGRYIFAREPIDAPMLAHELEHVRQWRRLGPLFLPAYILSSGYALARGEHPYRANRFERAARLAGEAGPMGAGAGAALSTMDGFPTKDVGY